MQTLTESEVAHALKCTKAALRRWRREGRGPRFIRIGRLVRYRVLDVENFLEKNASRDRLCEPETGEYHGARVPTR